MAEAQVIYDYQVYVPSVPVNTMNLILGRGISGVDRQPICNTKLIALPNATSYALLETENRELALEASGAVRLLKIFTIIERTNGQTGGFERNVSVKEFGVLPSDAYKVFKST